MAWGGRSSRGQRPSSSSVVMGEVLNDGPTETAVMAELDVDLHVFYVVAIGGIAYVVLRS